MKTYVIGIDPSFSRTGLSLIEVSDLGSTVVASSSLIVPTYTKDKYQLEFTMQGADWLANHIVDWIQEISNSYRVSLITIEYPVLSTRSGAYLGFIQQALYSLYPSIGIPVVGVPSNAIKSLSKYETKSQLVEWGKGFFKFSCETLRKGRWCINHDEMSAAALAHIGYLILSGQYKKSYKRFYK